jgi:ATP-dependent helicase HrpB
MPAILSQPKLPVDDILPALLDSIRTCPNVLLSAPPGAGKSTRVPLALLDVILPEAGRIVMLEPRRLAAVSIARRLANGLGEEVGRTVGYSIRFDSRVSACTRIEVVTEGILTRRIQNDPGLEGVALVIFDEFHERSIHADLGLALCRDIQKHIRPDLKLLVMSATLDILPLSRMLDDAPVISSAGRSFPVEEIYIDDRLHGKFPQRMTAAIVRALNEGEGDILAFLPGSGEIRNCAGLLADTGIGRRNIDIHQLYGDLPFAEQQRAIQPGDRRKIVLATSIAETSLTIEGVRIVIDSGMSRRVKFDASSGMNRLITVRESRASAEQRKGRAGRLAPGACYRLYSRHTLSAMTPHTPPEILEADLSPLLLELAAWGTADFSKLDWLDLPPAPSMAAARSLLEELDVFDDSGRITTLGQKMMVLPLHPRLGRLLLRSIELGCPSAGCDLAALISERDVFRSAKGDSCRLAGNSDVSDRLEALQNWRANSRQDDRLDVTALKNVERVVSQLSRLISCPPCSKRLICDDALISRLLAAAYPDRLARRRATGDISYLLVNGRGAGLSHRSGLRNAEFIIAVSLDAGSQSEAAIHMAAGISEEVIRDERSRHIATESTVSWSDREVRVIGVRKECLGAIQLSAEPIIPQDEMVLPVILEAVRASGLQLLNLDDALLQLQGRMALIRSAFPGGGWPDISNEGLLDALEVWLAPKLKGIRSGRKLAQLDVAGILHQMLDYRQHRELDGMAPTHMVVPSGSRIRLDYSGEVPVLSVKLQELFGLAEGPTVCLGRVPVLLHLLSPAGRPIQVTVDLKGFWNGAYHQVKKELKGRYPKHPWPDDPWSALPTRRLKPRG